RGDGAGRAGHGMDALGRLPPGDRGHRPAPGQLSRRAPWTLPARSRARRPDPPRQGGCGPDRGPLLPLLVVAVEGGTASRLRPRRAGRGPDRPVALRRATRALTDRRVDLHRPLSLRCIAGHSLSWLLPGALALAAPRFLLIGLPITLANFLTAHTYQHEIMWHYTAYLLGVLAVAVPLGAARWVAHADRVFRVKRLTGALAVSVAMLLIAGPHLVPWLGLWGGINEEEKANLEALITELPPEASVSATWSLAPHIAHREAVYTAPNPFQERFWGAGGKPPLPDPETVEYLAVDIRNHEPGDPMLTELSSGNWEVVVDGTFVLARRR